MNGLTNTELQKNGLTGKSLFGYLATLGLDAFNDNAYKVSVSLTVMAKLLPQEGGTLLISAASAVFILPYILVSSFAGSLTDRLSKRTILVGAKCGEVAVMAVGAAGFYAGHIPTLFVAMFLNGIQSAIFSPAKFAIIPELVEAGAIAKTNGRVEAMTFLAIVCGTAAGALLMPVFGDKWIGLCFVGVSMTSLLTSLWIPRVPAADPARRLAINPFGDVLRTLRGILGSHRVTAPMAGLTWFWFFGAFLQMSLLLFARQSLGLDETSTGLLLTALALSIGLGSLLAGRWSDRKIEIGLIPLGAVGMAGCTVALSFVNTAGAAACALFFLGLFGGLFIIPQDAMVQHRTNPAERGRVLAASNFLIFSGILLASGAFSLMSEIFGATPAWAIRAAGMAATVVAAYLAARLAAPLFRFMAWLFTHAVFDIRIRGTENIPHHGAAILAANHASFMDMAIIGASVQRMIRFLMLHEYFKIRWFKPICALMRAIPFKPGNGIEALERAAAELRAGKVVCIFPEGQISRNGQILQFRKGIEILAQKSGAPIIPIHIDGMRGGPVTEDPTGRRTWLPRKFPWRVTVTFGASMPATSNAESVRSAVVRMSSDAVANRPAVRSTLAAEFVRAAKKNWDRPAMDDSTGRSLTYGKLLTAVVSLRSIIRRQIPTANVGILLPTSVGAGVANLAVALAGKTAVNFNFTTSEESLHSAAERCGIRRVITSRRFIEKLNLTPPVEPVYLEDLMGGMSRIRSLMVYLGLRIVPAQVAVRLLVDRQVEPDSLAAIIFSSGSSGEPKGVMLSNANVLANVSALTDVFYEQTNERILGVLPFFHSFDWTGTLWYPLIRGFRVIYHPNPTDARAIAGLARRHGATFMVATPTFCRMYLRHIAPGYFAALRTIVVGAERLRPELAAQLRETYDADVFEGYGATECSPVISVNIPSVGLSGKRQRGVKSGTVGRPIPGVAVKVVDPDTFEERATGDEGLLLVGGPNVMQGYWKDPERTAQALRDSWYVTGDMAMVDAEGFITLTGRLARFAKIGGEMAPLGQIEETLMDMTGATDPILAVTAVADEARGERIVVVHTQDMDIPAILEGLKARGYPNLWIPKPLDFFRVEALPMLGTGKLDLMALRRLAEEGTRPACVKAQTLV